jgi:hypothetical protein
MPSGNLPVGAVSRLVADRCHEQLDPTISGREAASLGRAVASRTKRAADDIAYCLGARVGHDLSRKVVGNAFCVTSNSTLGSYARLPRGCSAPADALS